MDMMRTAPLANGRNWSASSPPLLRFLKACHKDFATDNSGEVAHYIPELRNAHPEHFGISLATLDGHVYETGDSRVPFTVQSISKPFVFALALDTLGAARVEAVIGVEPSGDPFNSIRLNAENHPFNPITVIDISKEFPPLQRPCSIPILAYSQTCTEIGCQSASANGR